MYRTLREHPRLLARGVHGFPCSAEEYYRVRSMHSDTMSPLERSIRFVYLNRHCFNGVYRTNRQGQFNVPIGARTGAIPSEAAFYRCSVALRSATLVSADFETTCELAENGDFVYLDPPYSSSDRKRYGEYGYESFQPIEIHRLAKALVKLDRIGCRFLLSYVDEPEVRDRMKRWCLTSLSAVRHVAGFSHHRGPSPELLISNYDQPSGDGQ